MLVKTTSKLLNKPMSKNLPPFTLAKAELRDPDTEYIYHNREPRLVCKVDSSKAIRQVELLEVLQTTNMPATTEEVNKTVKRMQHWYLAQKQAVSEPPQGEPTESHEPPYLVCVDKADEQMYILHRNYPACLIWVKQEIPVRFILVQSFDDAPESAFVGGTFNELIKKFYNEITADARKEMN